MNNTFCGIYKYVRNGSWQFLVDHKIAELPVNLVVICNQLGYVVCKDSKIHYLDSMQKGVSFYASGKWYIVFNDKLTLQAQRYTIAHELGHIFLGHQLTNEIHGSTFVMNNSLEYQAERFVIDILAPACVLWGLDLHTPQEIAEVCNISMTAATNRARRMEALYRRNMFLSHPLERQVFRQFESFIRQPRN